MVLRRKRKDIRVSPVRDVIYGDAERLHDCGHRSDTTARKRSSRSARLCRSRRRSARPAAAPVVRTFFTFSRARFAPPPAGPLPSARPGRPPARRPLPGQPLDGHEHGQRNAASSTRRPQPPTRSGAVSLQSRRSSHPRPRQPSHRWLPIRRTRKLPERHSFA
jgi:hypothetical protein